MVPRKILLVFLISIAAASRVFAAESNTIFQTQFDGPGSAAALNSWQHLGTGTVVLAPGYNGTQSLCVDQPPLGSTGGTSVMIPLNVDKIRGTTLTFQGLIKSNNVSIPAQTYNGVKFMLYINSPDGKEYPGYDHLWGTFDWKHVQFSAVIPQDATEAYLILGLQDSTGTAWFDNVSVTVTARPWPVAPVAAGPVYNGHPGVPRLRGTMVSADVTPGDLRVLGEGWHANLIRYQLNWTAAPNGHFDGLNDAAAYDAWLAGRLDYLDTLLPYCKKYGLRVVVDLHTPPGGDGMAPIGEWPMFTDKGYEDKFLKIWRLISTRYKDSKSVWGYDLANEPIQGAVAPGVMDWHAIATETAQVVRKIDPHHAIIVEAGPGGSFANLKYFKPLPVTGVVYSIHMYDPGQFTSQGVYPDLPIGVEYPSTIGGTEWDKKQMERHLAEVAEYQRRYHVSIYVGEFSAIRWAPDGSAYRYLKDATDIFEEHGWDWSYHAFREWQGWSTEVGSDPSVTTPSPTPTDREMLLRGLFAKNVKP